MGFDAPERDAATYKRAADELCSALPMPDPRYPSDSFHHFKQHGFNKRAERMLVTSTSFTNEDLAQRMVQSATVWVDPRHSTSFTHLDTFYTNMERGSGIFEDFHAAVWAYIEANPETGLVFMQGYTRPEVDSQEYTQLVAFVTAACKVVYPNYVRLNAPFVSRKRTWKNTFNTEVPPDYNITPAYITAAQRKNYVRKRPLQAPTSSPVSASTLPTSSASLSASPASSASAASSAS